MSDDFYRRLDEAEIRNRAARILRDRPENLHDYQGCEAEKRQVSEPIKVPSAGEPELSADLITDAKLEQVIGGLLIPSQGFSKAMARRITELEREYYPRHIEVEMAHPHPDRRHVMVSYRRAILGFKKKFGTARSQVHYRDWLNEYLEAKRDVLKERGANFRQGVPHDAR